MRLIRATVQLMIIISCSAQTTNDFLDLPEDGKLNFTEIGFKYSMPVEEHSVTTDDGYVLTIFHIPGDVKRPVFLMHGVIDTSDCYILRGNTSLAASLVRKGYDVWVGNSRGNRYARKHVSLDPNRDAPRFWDFTLHEIGYYDVAASVDYVLSKTKQSKLSIIAHSQGVSNVWVLLSTRPEYNDKIQVLILMGSIYAFTGMNAMLQTLWQSLGALYNTLIAFGDYEWYSDRMTSTFRLLCSQRGLGYTLCAREGLFVLMGPDPDELEPEFYRITIGHYPSSTSAKNFLHISQLALTTQFRQFDYGSARNMQLYSSASPPVYNMTNVRAKVVLFAAKNDRLSTLQDVAVIRRKLPNVVQYHLMDREQFNHVDYVWGRTSHISLHPLVLDALDKFS